MFNANEHELGDCLTIELGDRLYEAIYVSKCSKINYPTEYHYLIKELGKKAEQETQIRYTVDRSIIEDAEPITNLHYMTFKELSETLCAMENIFLIGYCNEDVDGEVIGTHVFLQKHTPNNEKIIHISTMSRQYRCDDMGVRYAYINWVSYDEFERITSAPQMEYHSLSKIVKAHNMTNKLLSKWLDWDVVLFGLEGVIMGPIAMYYCESERLFTHTYPNNTLIKTGGELPF